MKIKYLILFMVIAFIACQPAYEVINVVVAITENNEQVVVENKYTEIVVANPEEIKNLDTSFTIGDKCTVHVCGDFIELESPKEGEILVEYRAPNEAKRIGEDKCPSGALFLTTKSILEIYRMVCLDEFKEDEEYLEET